MYDMRITVVVDDAFIKEANKDVKLAAEEVKKVMDYIEPDLLDVAEEAVFTALQDTFMERQDEIDSEEEE